MKTFALSLSVLAVVFGIKSNAQTQAQSKVAAVVKSQECTIARVISEGVIPSPEAQTKHQSILSTANGIALTTRVLLVPDHFLIGDSRNVKVVLESSHRGTPVNESMTGQVIGRDHHVDVALVELDPAAHNLIPCDFSFNRTIDLSEVVLKGFKDLNTHLIHLPIYRNDFFDLRSKNLEVPGIDEALEFRFYGDFPTLSGSPLTSDGKVVAILNAINKNAAFAAFAADLVPVARELLRETLRIKKTGGNSVARIDRNYTFNSVLEQFEFSGLVVRGGDQIADAGELIAGEGTAHKPKAAQRGEGTAHTAEGTAHKPRLTERAEGTAHRSVRSRIYGTPDFSNLPVSGGNDLGFVVARVNPDRKDEFKTRHPELALRLENSIDNTIRIYRIDGRPVTSIFSLLKVLASVGSDYRITEVLTRFQSEGPAQNDYAASANDGRVLMQKIIDSSSITGDLKTAAVSKLRELVSVLTQLDLEFTQTQRVNSALEDRAVALWDALDSAGRNGPLYQLATQRQLGAEDVALRNAIRSRLPFNSVF